MPKRRMSHYQLFATSYLRTHLRPGMTRLQRNQVMKDCAAAWRRALKGRNPFPDVHIDFVEGNHNGSGGQSEGAASSVACPDCGELLAVSAAIAGEEVECPGCRGRFTVAVE